MPPENKALASRKPEARSRVSNGQDILAGIDGRSLKARRYRDIMAAMISDQGGLTGLSEARLQLCRRFAAQSLLAEDIEACLANGGEVRVEEHAMISSTLVRLASRLGIDRRVRRIVPDLEDYLERGKTVAAPECDAEPHEFAA